MRNLVILGPKSTPQVTSLVKEPTAALLSGRVTLIDHPLRVELMYIERPCIDVLQLEMNQVSQR